MKYIINKTILHIICLHVHKNKFRICSKGFKTIFVGLHQNRRK